MPFVKKGKSSPSQHTKENIFAKLNSHLTDSERTSYIKILEGSLDTALLLTVVVVEWGQQLLQQQLQIECLKEKIRVKQEYIDFHTEVQKRDGFSVRVEEQIDLMQKHIDTDNIVLNDMLSSYEKNTTYFEKSSSLVSNLEQNPDSQCENGQRNITC